MTRPIYIHHTCANQLVQGNQIGERIKKINKNQHNKRKQKCRPQDLLHDTQPTTMTHYIHTQNTYKTRALHGLYTFFTLEHTTLYRGFSARKGTGGKVTGNGQVG